MKTIFLLIIVNLTFAGCSDDAARQHAGRLQYLDESRRGLHPTKEADPIGYGGL